MDTKSFRLLPKRICELASNKNLGTGLFSNNSEFELWGKDYLFEESLIRARSIYGILLLHLLK